MRMSCVFSGRLRCDERMVDALELGGLHGWRHCRLTPIRNRTMVQENRSALNCSLGPLNEKFPPVKLPLFSSLRCGLISMVVSTLGASMIPGLHPFFPSCFETSGVGGFAIFAFAYKSALGGYSVCDIFSATEKKRLVPQISILGRRVISPAELVVF